MIINLIITQHGIYIYFYQKTKYYDYFSKFTLNSVNSYYNIHYFNNVKQNINTTYNINLTYLYNLYYVFLINLL